MERTQDCGRRNLVRYASTNLGHGTDLWYSYIHILTGVKRPHRDEAKSGIIADEMGLGKTLVILSAIAGSMEIATTFVSHHAKTMSSSPRIQYHASRATLIIAPSTRKDHTVLEHFVWELS